MILGWIDEGVEPDVERPRVATDDRDSDRMSLLEVGWAGVRDLDVEQVGLGNHPEWPRRVSIGYWATCVEDSSRRTGRDGARHDAGRRKSRGEGS